MLGLKKESIAPGLRGRERLAVMRLHRLLEFEAAFDGYLQGQVSAAVVSSRARKMIEIGLPVFKR